MGCVSLSPVDPFNTGAQTRQAERQTVVVFWGRAVYTLNTKRTLHPAPVLRLWQQWRPGGRSPGHHDAVTRATAEAVGYLNRRSAGQTARPDYPSTVLPC